MGAHDLLGVGDEDDAGDDLATTALVLGLLSLVLSVLAGVPALVAGLVALLRPRRAVRGVVRAGAAVVLGAASVVVAVLLVRAVAPVWETARAVGQGGAEDVLVSGSPQARAAAQEAAVVLGQVGVDPGSLDCGSPDPGLRLEVSCEGTDAAGAPVAVVGSCPAGVLAGEARCELRVDGVVHEVRVVLSDGVPRAELLPG